MAGKEGDGDFGHGGSGTAWYGGGASDAEKVALQKLAEKFGITDITDVDEGDENDEFWDALGGKEEYFTLPRTNASILS